MGRGGGGDNDADDSGKRALPPRASRGTRMHRLIGEEAEADDAFWSQGAWREDEEDDDYSSEAEEEDVVDSDFDEEEVPDDEVHDEDDADEKRGGRLRGRETKKMAYSEPKKRATMVPVAKKLQPKHQPPDQSGKPTTPTPPLHPSSTTTATVSYTTPQLRRSTSQKSSASSDLRRKIMEEAARLAEKAPKKPTTGKPRFTQHELLREAVRMEVENTQSLSRLEQLEEEKKAEQVLAPKTPFTGRVVRYHSRIGQPKTITFLNTDEYPSIFNQEPPSKRVRLQPAAASHERSVASDEEDEDEDADGDDTDEMEEKQGGDGMDKDMEQGDQGGKDHKVTVLHPQSVAA